MRRLKSQDDVGDKLFQIWDRKFDVVWVIVNENKESKPIQNHPFIKQGKKEHYFFAALPLSLRIHSQHKGLAIYTPLI